MYYRSTDKDALKAYNDKVAVGENYDGTTLSSATSTAITSLKSKNWAISINSVIQ